MKNSGGKWHYGVSLGMEQPLLQQGYMTFVEINNTLFLWKLDRNYYHNYTDDITQKKKGSGDKTL